MTTIFNEFQWEILLIYMDDIIIFSKTFDQHLEHLGKVFGKLRHSGLKLNANKCEFGMTQVRYLGHVINREGIHPNPEKVTAISNFPKPQNMSDVRRFLGLVLFYRRFIKDFADIAKPLTDLMQKNVTFQWTKTM